MLRSGLDRRYATQYVLLGDPRGQRARAGLSGFAEQPLAVLVDRAGSDLEFAGDAFGAHACANERENVQLGRRENPR